MPRLRDPANDRYVGKQFGRWTVLEFLRREGTQYFYRCQCACGSIREVRSGQFSLSNPRASQSCGCYAREVWSRVHRGNKYRRLEQGEGSRNHLLSSYKRGAKARGLSFLLSLDDFERLTKGNCFYCGTVPKAESKRKFGNGNYLYNGIDRVDNSRGYEPDNCVSCCTNCNMLKSAVTKQIILKAAQFLAWDKIHRDGVLVEMPGLLERRRAEMNLFNLPDTVP